MSTGQDRTKSIVVFASGEGTLFAAIASPDAQAHHGYAVSALVTNRMSCGAAKMARELGVAVVSSSEFEVDLGLQPQLVVLAGYLRLIPDVLIQRFPKKMINSHPSLLPKFGGKGMYGRFVHQAVIDAGQIESGFTVHYVSKDYDEGEVIYQERLQLSDGETAESLAQKIKSRERRKLPEIIGQLVKG